MQIFQLHEQLLEHLLRIWRCQGHVAWTALRHLYLRHNTHGFSDCSIGHVQLLEHIIRQLAARRPTAQCLNHSGRFGQATLGHSQRLSNMDYSQNMQIVTELSCSKWSKNYT